MAISYPRDLPNMPIKSTRFGLSVNQAVFEAGLSRKVTIQSHASGKTDRWTGVFSTARLSASQVRELSTWLVSMKGREKKFYIYDMDRKMPGGVAVSASSTPLVNGASQLGTSIVSDGWLASTTGLLIGGDYIQIGTGYHMVLEDASSDVGGNAIINFEPALRTSPADNAAIIFEAPKLIARLGGIHEGWETGIQKTAEISVPWEEVI
jgi:hypothetical protein